MMDGLKGLIEKYKAWSKYPEKYNTKTIFAQINSDLNWLEEETSEKVALNIADVTASFTANDVDGAYLIGVFNVSGIDGLQKEIVRIKKLGLNPSAFLTILKNER